MNREHGIYYFRGYGHGLLVGDILASIRRVVLAIFLLGVVVPVIVLVVGSLTARI